jgi:cellulose synthase/poly-beta-1,6-N-acetylglucosamine synthase-like glycosyltransferase
MVKTHAALATAHEPTSPLDYLNPLHFPLPDGSLAAADLSAEARSSLERRYGYDIRIVKMSRRELLAATERKFRQVCRRNALHQLREREPQFSAATTITRAQIKAFAMLCLVLAVCFVASPGFTGTAIVGALASVLLVTLLFRVILWWAGRGQAWRPPVAAPVPDDELPDYTILVPLYREANVLSHLAAALRAIDYPRDRLDIKLIVEEDDLETATAAEAATAFDPQFSIVRVPYDAPRTKPRACNYALSLAVGEFTVIFDAEDRPEPDQLRKAVAAFRTAPAHVACLQARLEFFNANENWLTKSFALDYFLWFGHLLPGLERLNIPMPLGGTSNHFRTAALRSIHGWDPYNVTEDADIGIRLARLGLRTRTLDSTTFEEAANTLHNWLRQRSRWLKGYMQTWLVHMRSPAELYRSAGLGGFIGFQLFIGGTFLSALANPFLWLVFLFSHMFGVSLLGPPLSNAISAYSGFGLVAGNTLFASLAVVAPRGRGLNELTPYGLTAPAYWLLVSLAALRAAWQLVRDPFYWEKTAHGLSTITARDTP